jgi:quercetin dioxygenase-like cupin family protein
MTPPRFAAPLTVLGVLLLLACGDQEDTPTGLMQATVQPADMHSMHGAAVAADPSLDPFTFRAPLDPYRIQQMPEFMIRSGERKDIVIQRSIFPSGAGIWHTHPGPSFIYVIDGEIKLERFTPGKGCAQTPVYTPGDAYYEIADQVHRAIVVSSKPAVLLVTRFNIPINGAITIPAADPGC